MMLPSPKQTALALALLCLALGGCGPDRPNMAPVSGVVTYQGQPVVGARVVFHNDLAPRAATGTTDQEGKFRLTTFENFDGAVPGEHVVTISKLQADAAVSSASADDPSAAYGQGMMAAASGNMEAIQKNELPAKYADPKTSELTRTVSKEGPNEFEINLE
jgi:hypothetical protein